MLTSEARVETDRPERYLTQICNHAAAMGAGGHRMGGHGDHAQAAQEVSAECSETRGVITFAAWGTCVIAAVGSTLTLRVEAADPESLRRIQEVLTRDLDRFGRRDGLVVSWQD